MCRKNFVANSSLAPALVWLEVRTTTACLGYVGFGIDNAVAPINIVATNHVNPSFQSGRNAKIINGYCKHDDLGSVDLSF